MLFRSDLLSRLQNRPGFADRLILDAYRLMRRTESMTDDTEYAGMAQLAVQAALPGEAVAVLDEVRAGIPSHVTGDLNARPHLSPGEIRERMSGNICRCGAYSNIVDAITEVAGSQT